MKPVRYLLCLVLAWMLAACGVTSARFPGTVVPPPADLSGQWQLVLGGQTSVFVLTPAAPNHYHVTSPGANDPATSMDASIQVYRDAQYLVVADTAQAAGVSVFRITGFSPAGLRIAALDPKKTQAVLEARGMPIAYKKMWLYDEIVLSGAAMQAVLAVPAADVFAMSEEMTLQRVQ
jgi:hypothetical protein